MKVSIFVYPLDSEQNSAAIFELWRAGQSAEQVAEDLNAYRNLGKPLVLEDCYTNYEGNELRIVLREQEPAV